MQALDPGFLPRHAQGRQHQIRLQREQLLFQARPGLGRLKAMHGHHQLQAGVVGGSCSLSWPITAGLAPTRATRH